MSEDVTPYGGEPGGNARTIEFRALLAELGMSQRECADALEVDVRTVRYWAAANPEPPLVAIFALRYMVENQAREILTPARTELPASARTSESGLAVDEFRRLVLDIEAGRADVQRVERSRMLTKRPGQPAAPTNVYVTSVRYEYRKAQEGRVADEAEGA